MPLRLLTNVKLNKNQSHLVITICTVLWVSYSQTARNSDWFITLFAPVCLVWVITLVSFFRESFENCSMTPDAKAFTMAYIPEFAAIDLEPFAFFCIKRRAWALKGFTIADEWLNDMCLCVALTYPILPLLTIDLRRFSNGRLFHSTSRTVELVLQFAKCLSLSKSSCLPLAKVKPAAKWNVSPLLFTWTISSQVIRKCHFRKKRTVTPFLFRQRFQLHLAPVDV